MKPNREKSICYFLVTIGTLVAIETFVAIGTFVAIETFVAIGTFVDFGTFVAIRAFVKYHWNLDDIGFQLALELRCHWNLCLFCL